MWVQLPPRPSSMNKYILKKAVSKAAKDCTVVGVQVVAIAFSGKNIIAMDTNRRLDGFGDKRTYHAEEMVIRKLWKLRAKDRMGEIKMAVVRVRSDGTVESKQPCKSCMRELDRYGIIFMPPWTNGWSSFS